MIGAQPVDERAGLVHDGHVGVAEPVNRLLPIAHEKNRGRERSPFGNADALTPRSNEQGHERPLGAARILKLVEQHVVIAPLESVPAPRELVHLREQRQRLGERLRKVEDAVRIERLPVFSQRDLVNAPHGPRQHRVQIAPECLERVRHFAADAKHVVPVNLPGIRGSAVLGGIPVEPLPRLFVLIEEMILDAVEHPAREPRRRHRAARNHPHPAGEDGPSPVMDRAVGEKSFDASGEPGEDTAQPLERVLAGALCGQVARPGRQRAIDRIIDDEPAVDHVREAVPQPLLPQLGKQQPHVVVGPRQTAADIERAIQRLLHQARHLRLVSHLEARIEIRLEWELAKQRQAERVDGADGDVARALAHLAPQLPIRPFGLRALTQLIQDAARAFPRRLFA